MYSINCRVLQFSQIEHTCVAYIQIKNLNAKIMFYFCFSVSFLLDNKLHANMNCIFPALCQVSKMTAK